MTSYEMVEKLSEKNGITLQEARTALEQSNWDMLDAMIYLEQQGEAMKAQAQAATAPVSVNAIAPYVPQSEYGQANQSAQQATENTVSFSELLGRFCGWLEKLINKGFSSNLVITKDGKHIGSIPLLVLVILLLCAFWCVVPILILLPFVGFNYSFGSVNGKKESLKDKTSTFKEKVRADFKKGMNEAR